MIIVHFLYDCPGNPWLGGGGAVRAQEINQRLVARGHEVHMICGAFPGKANADWVMNGVHWHSCGDAQQYGKSRLQFSMQCRKRFTNLKLPVIDLVVEDVSPFSLILSSMVWKGPRISLVQNFMGKNLTRKFGPLGWIFRVYEQFLLRSTSPMIAVSRSLQQQILENNHAAKITVIYNGVEDTFFEVSNDPSNTDAGNLLYIGRLEIYQKGLDTMLDAFEMVLTEKPEARLQIVGSGKDEALLKAMIHQRHLQGSVTLHGKMGLARIALLQKAELVLMPSRFESWGIVAIEAAALARPVIASDIPGLNEAVKHDKTGVLVALESGAAGFAQAILSLLNHPKKAQELGASAAEYSKKFRWDEIAQETEALYRQECGHA